MADDSLPKPQGTQLRLHRETGKTTLTREVDGFLKFYNWLQERYQELMA
jgi:hypothetical protein